MLLTLAFGDAGTLGDVVVGAPTLVLTLANSRAFETEADARAIELIDAAGLSRASYAALWESLIARCGAAGCGGGWLDTHPAADERVGATRRGR